MHLLLAQKGEMAEAGAAIDLGQAPADIVFLSTADTDLSSLAQAYESWGENKPSLRLVNLMHLAHPMSLDLYLEKTASRSRLMIVRLLGGKSYWPYGVTSLHALSVEKKIPLAALPGDDKPDPELLQFSTITPQYYQQLWHYLCQGGAHNMVNFLKFCSFLLDGKEPPPPPAPLLPAGLWWPGCERPDIDMILDKNGGRKAGIVPIIFYRSLYESGQTEAVAALIGALQQRNLTPMPIFIASLKDSFSCAILAQIFDQCPPDLVLNATGFAVSPQGGERSLLERAGNMVLQVTFSSTSLTDWQDNPRGLGPRDLAMNIALPEMDGRIFTRAVSFKSLERFDVSTQCNLVTYQPVASRCEFVADLAANWLKLRHKLPHERRIALIMANYPGGDARLAHGVGLDTPASTVHILHALQACGYDVGDNLPQDADILMQHLCQLLSMTRGPTNEGIKGRTINVRLSLEDYQRFFENLPYENQQQIRQRWGEPEQDAYFSTGGFTLPLLFFGKIVVGLQPDRAYGLAAKQTYHAADIVPSHHYMAFYFFLRYIHAADAIVHIGKHGNLEWLPGKALALSEQCYPELALGPLPHIYPFIVNDPGEGTQAKRRSAAVIIDHMTPPLTRAESYGMLHDLEVLVDEYYQASGFDPRRLALLKVQILDLVQRAGLDVDAGIKAEDEDDLALQKLDAYLCDLKELQIRDGLHSFGHSPSGRQLDHLIVALVRSPHGLDKNTSLHRAIAADFAFDFDPLNCDMAAPWTGARPDLLQEMGDDVWRTQGDAIERIELLALALVGGQLSCPAFMQSTRTVLDFIDQTLRPQLAACGQAEMDGLLQALSGNFVPPGPSGAPTRGRLDVLPTGRNFFSLDNRSLPTPAAWDLGARSAQMMITRYVQEHGDWPRSFALTAWGTANMRTGGDDIAQALALIGARPVWDVTSNRVTGYEIVPLAKLGRPRIDVTLRISGFFRDAFPEQIILFDQAIRAVGQLQGEGDQNPIAIHMRDEMAALVRSGKNIDQAQCEAGYRIFGTRPGGYGTGVQGLIDGDGDYDATDLGEIFARHSSYAYGRHDGVAALASFQRRLDGIEVIVQNQDNREHDLLDSGEYYAFEGGMAAAVAARTGQMPVIFHNDLSRPEPSELAATVDYLYAFAVTTGMVRDAHFDAIYQAYLEDERVCQFLIKKNPAALKMIAGRLREAVRRGLWHTRSNSIISKLDIFLKE